MNVSVTVIRDREVIEVRRHNRSYDPDTHAEAAAIIRGVADEIERMGRPDPAGVAAVNEGHR